MTPEALLLVVLGTVGLGTAAVLWQLYVRPDVVLSWLSRGVLSDGDDLTGDGRVDALDEEIARPLRLLRWAVGALVFGVGALIGAAIAFLGATQ